MNAPKYDPAATVEVGEIYRYKMLLRPDLVVRVTRVWDSGDGQGQMTHCEILSGGYDSAEDVAKYGEPAREMDTRAWTLAPCELPESTESVSVDELVPGDVLLALDDVQLSDSHVVSEASVWAPRATKITAVDGWRTVVASTTRATIAARK